MTPVIEVMNISKKYRLGRQEPYYTLRDSLMKLWRRSEVDPPAKEFWALKDVSFNVFHGEILGVIGPNGAGKSTLLKILSRITPPTKGEAIIRGSVASLLEVGTGFNPELTGRENIYLSSSILGLRRKETKKRFEEIVDFAGIEKFMGTPVKYYSSGMYTRLAFSVASFLEADVLLVDEVLAVGDAEFQKKSLGKMEEVTKKEGRTIIFVSHNMEAIERLCQKVILLDKGKTVAAGDDVRSIIKKYIMGSSKQGQFINLWVNRGKDFENPWFKPSKFFIADEKGDRADVPARNDSNIWVHIEGEIRQVDSGLTVGYAIYDEEGTLLYWSCQKDGSEASWPRTGKGKCILRSRIPSRFLNEGLYKLDMIASLHYREWLCHPGVRAPSIYLNIRGGLSDSPFWMVKRPGIMAPLMEWKNGK